MFSKLYFTPAIIGLTLLSACSTTTEVLVRTVKVKCPPILIELECTKYEKFGGGTLGEHLRYDEDIAVQNQCKEAALDLWKEAWEDC